MTLSIEGKQIVNTSNEGVKKSLNLLKFISLTQDPLKVGEIYPDGVKMVIPTKLGWVVLHETPPITWNFKWIDAKSKANYGDAAKYKKVEIALPYVYLVMNFNRGLGGLPYITECNECYFSNEVVRHLGQVMRQPALLNCSVMEEPRGNWICTQYSEQPPMTPGTNFTKALSTSLGEIHHTMFETGFNLSSEHHEGASWFGKHVEQEVDPKIASIEAWVKATKKDPKFATKVNWIEAKPIGEILENIVKYAGGGPIGDLSIGEIAGIIVKHGKKVK